ncbi:hypothetical protein L7F22_013603 [Adiantum nelumboides]|nr:hypothetical protein [Adiantum nelumboides]
MVGLTIETLIARIVQEDTMHRGSTTQEQSPPSAQYLQRPPRPFQKKPFCRYQASSSNQSQNIIKTCRYCGRRGHVEKECRTKRRDQQIKRGGRPGANNLEMDASNPGQYGLNSLQLFASVLNASNTLSPLNAPGTEWLLDTGPTHHMTPRRHWLTSYKPFSASVPIYLGDNHRLNAKGIGHMPVVLPSGTQVLIHGIYYIPGLSRNLLFVTAATSTGSSIEFFHDYCVIHFKLPSGGYEVIKLPHKNRLYPILLSSPDSQAVNITSSALTVNLTKASTTLLWHYRLGHINSSTLQGMAKRQLCNGIPTNLTPIDLCEGCLLGKASHQSFPRSQTRSSQLNQLVHSDV